MSGWTHRVCSACWAKANPDRMPVHVLDAPESVCCGCGRIAPTGLGIYIRAEPGSLKCENHGPEHEDSAP